MNWKNYKLLIFGGGTFLLVAIGCLVYAWMVSGQNKATQQELDRAINRLRMLKSSDPFPSPQNATIIRENTQKLNEVLDVYKASFFEGQLKPETGMSPLAFRSYLEGKIQALRDAATSDETDDENRVGVKVAPDYHFGFPRYVAGQVPNPEHVARLSIQVQAVDVITRTLFNNGIRELVSIERDAFEVTREEDNEPEEENPRSRRNTKPEEPALSETLFERDQFTFVFQSDEAVFWNVLDDIAGMDIPIEIRRVLLKNGNKKLQPDFERKTQRATATVNRPNRFSRFNRIPSAQQNNQANAQLESEQTVVAGVEPVITTLEISVLRLNESDPNP